jgi:NADP-reducing hydrogenase subunit HndB
MKSLEELRQIKRRALQRRRLSSEGSHARVVVAMGTCGIAAGARDTMSAILTELEQRDIADVIVTQTGCPGLCEYEPIVQVQIGEQEMVTYGNVCPDRVAVLVQEHIAGGSPVEKWQLK